MDLTLSSELRGTACVVSVSGKIDQLSADDFHRQLKPFLDQCGADLCSLVLDLSGVKYVSSAGLRIFMLASREIKPRHGKLSLVGLQPVVKEIFEISKFSLLFPIYDRIDDALA